MLDSGSKMEMFQLIFGIILLIAVKYLVFQFIYDRNRRSKLSKQELEFDKIRSIYNQLKKNKTPKLTRVMKYANICTFIN